MQVVTVLLTFEFTFVWFFLFLFISFYFLLFLSISFYFFLIISIPFNFFLIRFTSFHFLRFYSDHINWSNDWKLICITLKWSISPIRYSHRISSLYHLKSFKKISNHINKTEPIALWRLNAITPIHHFRMLTVLYATYDEWIIQLARIFQEKAMIKSNCIVFCTRV